MVRLNKYIASCGVCSRRRAEEYILNGDVSINGVKTTNLSTIIDEENDVVTLLGKKLEIKQEYLYIMLNKPKGYITTNKEQFNRKCTLDLIHEKTRVFPIGRLDMNTEGLLLFTNDGDFANKLMHPRNKMEKTYIVTTNTKITDKMVADLKSGVDIGGYITKKCKVEKINEETLKIIISEGKNRQVRRMCEAVGIKILNLKRTQIGNIKLENLPIGKYRYLSEKEIKELKN